MFDQWLSDLGDRLYLLRDRYVQWRGDRGLRDAIADVVRHRIDRWRSRVGEYKRAIARDVSKPKLIALVLACFVIVAGLAWIYVQTRPPPSTDAPHRAYFFDLTTGKLFTGMSDRLPPVEVRSGDHVDGMPAGVRAYVFSCGNCGDEQSRTIGYLETFTPKVRDLVMNRPPDQEGKPPIDLSGDIAKGQWVAKAPGQSWKPAPPSEPKPSNVGDVKKPATDVAKTPASDVSLPSGASRTPELANNPEAADAVPEPTTMRFGGIDWVLMAGGDGQAIVRDAASKPCGDGRLPAQCLP